MPIEITNDNDFKNSIADNLVVVDFYAQWCGPCKKFAPIFSKLAEEYPSIKFLKVDIDKCEKTAHKYKVSSIPTFMFFKNGELYQKFSGADEKKVRNTIQELLK
jgi:thioredoxin 1